MRCSKNCCSRKPVERHTGKPEKYQGQKLHRRTAQEKRDDCFVVFIFTDITHKIEVAVVISTIATIAVCTGWLQWLLLPCPLSN